LYSKGILSFKSLNENFDLLIKNIWISLKTDDLKNKFLEELELHGVETRAIISGNFARQPVFKKYKIINSNKFKKADYISQYYFFIGLYPNPLKESELNKLINIFLNCYKKIKK